MAAPAITVTDILISPAWVFYAPVGTTLPLTTLAVNGNWGAAWIPLGSTLTPVTLAYEQDVLDLKVQQTTGIVRSKRTGERVMIETSLAEVNGVNLGLMTDGTVSTTAAAGASPGFNTIKTGGDREPSIYAFGIEGVRLTSTGAKLPIRMIIYRGRLQMNGAMEFSQDNGIGIPIQIVALADTSKAEGENLLIIHNINVAGT